MINNTLSPVLSPKQTHDTNTHQLQFYQNIGCNYEKRLQVNLNVITPFSCFLLILCMSLAVDEHFSGESRFSAQHVVFEQIRGINETTKPCLASTET